jgi:plastocyanin
MKNMLLAFALFSVVAVFFVACGSSPGAATSNTPVVHMNDTNFVQPDITIKKGQSLTLTDDTSTTHIVSNGTWDANGNQKPGAEHGAPAVALQFQGDDSQAAGPFNTAGTYHLYCSIHPNMNLTVSVQ